MLYLIRLAVLVIAAMLTSFLFAIGSPLLGSLSGFIAGGVLLYLIADRDPSVVASLREDLGKADDELDDYDNLRRFLLSVYQDRGGLHDVEVAVLAYGSPGVSDTDLGSVMANHPRPAPLGHRVTEAMRHAEALDKLVDEEQYEKADVEAAVAAMTDFGPGWLEKLRDLCDAQADTANIQED